MKRKRLSAYDRLLLLVFAFGILLVFVRYRTLSDSPLTPDGEIARITYILQSDSKARASALAQAEVVLFADTRERFGALENAPSISPAYRDCVRADGTLADLPSERSCELRGTLIAHGSFTENGFFAGGQRHITANQQLSVLMNGLNVTILILNVSHFSSK